MTEIDLHQTASTTENAPCLPGFENETETVTPPPVAASLTSASVHTRVPGLKRILAYALVAAVAAIAAVGACRLIRPRTVIREVVKETRIAPDGVPLQLLPETADPALWDTVANMSGSIEGINLTFRRGLASAKDIDFRLCLDFCQGRDFVYARVAAGATTWVVVVNNDRKIVRAYRVPRSNKKPLRDLFARR